MSMRRFAALLAVACGLAAVSAHSMLRSGDVEEGALEPGAEAVSDALLVGTGATGVAAEHEELGSGEFLVDLTARRRPQCGKDSYCKCWQNPPVCHGSDKPCKCKSVRAGGGG